MEETTQVADAGQAEVTQTTEVQTTASTENTPVVTPEAAAASAVKGTVGEPAPYTPNFKFKVYDEEKEFDEDLRPLITNKQLEEKFRELYTKAHGLDGLKPKHEKLRAEFEAVAPIKQKYQSLSESLGALSYYVGKDDFDSFFQTLRIPEDKIYRWVNRKIQEQEMSPEQKADLQARRDEQQRLYMLEKQNETAMARLESFEQQQNRAQLDAVLAKPEIAGVAQAFDSKVGVPGAFMNEVIKRGATLYHLTGQDLSPEQVVQDLMQTIGKVVEPLVASPQGNQPNPGGQARPPVIPHIQSKSMSPVKKSPRSIEDIRKIANGMA